MIKANDAVHRHLPAGDCGRYATCYATCYASSDAHVALAFSRMAVVSASRGCSGVPMAPGPVSAGSTYSLPSFYTGRCSQSER